MRVKWAITAGLLAIGLSALFPWRTTDRGTEVRPARKFLYTAVHEAAHTTQPSAQLDLSRQALEQMATAAIAAAVATFPDPRRNRSGNRPH